MDDRAIVIGAGIAGLTAARVLSRRYAHVTVLDRDTLPYDASPRRGVPQGAHPHILLVGGRRELSALFPGIDDELTALGGVPVESGKDLCSFRFGRRWPAVSSGYVMISVTRPQLEAVIRARVTALPGVAIRDQISVSGLAGRVDLVTGVVLDTGETLDASLVVDCSGRGSRSDRWLAALGVDPPAELEIKVGVSYSTRIYRRLAGDLDRWRAAFIQPTPPDGNLSGVAIPIEGERWMVALGGWHLPDPPADPAAFEAYARSLPDPIIPALIGRAEPLSDVQVTRFPASRRRLFEKLGRVPGGYVALGDAICSVNPIYGQGMTCAIREAAALGKILDRHHRSVGPALVRDYYAAAAEIVDTPWRMAAGSDFAFPATTGPRPRGHGARTWYTRKLALASQLDPDIYRTLIAVQHLVEPPSTLFRPGLAARVIRLAGNRRRADGVPS